MAEAAVRCLRDGRLEGEHAPALAVVSTLQCCPLAARAMLHLAAAVASHAAAGKAQARGLVIVAFDRSPKVYLDFMRRRGLDQNALNRCVRILDCYSDPIGWKQKIRSQQQQESSAVLCSMNKENVQFNLELSEKERTVKANVVLPFEHQGKGEPIRIYDGRRSLPEAQRDPNLTSSTLLDEVKLPKSATPKGEIHYIRDSDDEQPDSDEDPDDDLDI
ncbi:hypothetical protein E2562_027798 [Oryza meyeriana var. granulata]|uniref:Elongator complex protein 5 n=1 Tax=Oryza meyeriana var. granulata TaxID=110450 RepID=A0A6G1DPU0_9ORYZ|nr:hypothetical protein E2562_027798 [Oryza meyeriana var. granulata]